MASSIAAGATAIQTALTSASVRSTQDPRIVGTSTGYGPPIVVVLGNGAPSVAGIGRAGFEYQYRLVCVGAVIENSPKSLTALRALVTTVLSTMRDLAQYRLISLGPESEGDYAGGKYLAADLIVSTYIA